MSAPPLPWERLADLAGAPAQPGTVHLVGGGPGDPGLVGLHAAHLLATATVVAHDRLSPPELLQLCHPDCHVVDVGKQPDRHPLSQDEINQLLVDHALAGEAVVRLKGGDPLVLGRGTEEALACRAAGVPFELVPAVTSAIAAPAYAGIPVTHRGVAGAFAVVTGHEDPTKPTSQVDWGALAAFPGTLVVLMGVGRLREIAAALVAGGRDPATPVALVRWGTTPRQEELHGTLADIADRVAAAGFGAPAVTVVGPVAELGRQLAWFTARPLHGRTVLVPRTRQQASQLSARLRALGAQPIEAPTIAIAPTRDPDRLRAAVARIRDGAYAWTALTSPNGVDAVWEAVTAQGGDARWLAGTRLAAVGSGTAARLERHGLRPDLVPDTFTTRGLAAALVAATAPGERVLLPRADLASPVLAEQLAAAGCEVEEVEAYRTVAVDALDDEVADGLRTGRIDAVALASSSTAANLVALLGDVPHPDVKVVSIGPVTSATCDELGMAVAAEADPHDIDGLVAAVARALSERC